MTLTSRTTAIQRTRAIDNLITRFLETYGGDERDVWVFFAPGRVNLIGEHTDYNGGLVLPAAISPGIYAAVRYDGGEWVCLASLNERGNVTVSLAADIGYDASNGWANYPLGVLKYLLKEGFCVPGGKVLYWADLPIGAGLSSSAALELVTAYAFAFPTYGVSADRRRLAILCRRAENEFVGVDCGIMDQFVVAMGKRDSAVLLDCDTLVYRYVPIGFATHRFVIINTGKKRSLAESRYNERRDECRRCLDMVNAAGGKEGIPGRYRSLARVPLTEAGEAITDPILLRRARHVISENQRTLAAEAYLSEGDARKFGELMTESHRSLKEDYEVTGPELDAVVEESLRFKGCAGARMTGAGFGGCAIALVETVRLREFVETVGRAYRERTGLEPAFYPCSAVDGVECLREGGEKRRG